MEALHCLVFLSFFSSFYALGVIGLAAGSDEIYDSNNAGKGAY